MLCAVYIFPKGKKDTCNVFSNDRNAVTNDSFLYIVSRKKKYCCAYRNETADAYMRLYSEDNKRVTEAVYGRKYKLRVGVNNLDSTYIVVIYFIPTVLFFSFLKTVNSTNVVLRNFLLPRKQKYY